MSGTTFCWKEVAIIPFTFFAMEYKLPLLYAPASGTLIYVHH